MFGRKTKLLQEEVYGRASYWCPYPMSFRIDRKVGLIEKVRNLENENKKLKAVVAELCDYVYREQK